MSLSAGKLGNSADVAAQKRRFWLWVVCALFVATFGFELAIHDRALVDPPPEILRGIGAVAGLTLGVLASIGIFSRPDIEVGFRQITGFLMLPLFAAVAGSYYVRTAYEITIFFGSEPTPYQQWVVVKGTDGPGRRSFGYGATVYPIDGSREISVPIDEDLYYKLEPYRQPGRDCLILDGEIVQGIRRVRVPTKLLDTLIGVRQYRSCEAAPKR